MIVEIIITAILIVMAIFILIGKGDFLIAGYNTASEEKKKRYNLPRLRFIIAAFLIVVALGKIVILFRSPDVVESGIYSAVIVVIALFAVILCNTWAKKKD